MQQHLQTIIDQLKNEAKETDARFGIFRESMSESYIKANPQGLKLFAAALLSTAVAFLYFLTTVKNG